MTDKKVYKVWKVLLKSPNEWIDIVNLAKITNLTVRQTFAICERMPSPPVFRRRDPIWNDAQVSIQGTDKEINDEYVRVTSKYYGITDDMCAAVYSALPLDDWITVKELSTNTGMTRNELIKTLSVLGNVVVKSTGRLSMYRKGGVE